MNEDAISRDSVEKIQSLMPTEEEILQIKGEKDCQLLHNQRLTFVFKGFFRQYTGLDFI